MITQKKLKSDDILAEMLNCTTAAADVQLFHKFLSDRLPVGIITSQYHLFLTAYFQRTTRYLTMGCKQTQTVTSFLQVLIEQSRRSQCVHPFLTCSRLIIKSRGYSTPDLPSS